MIRVEHVSHWFGSMQVLRDLSMHVPAGEIFGFIGPNGAGKTTTIRMMATLLEPDDGRVLVDGIDVVEAPAEVRKVLGFMPDAFGVYDRITVVEYLEFFAAAHGIGLGARERTVSAVMELTDLGPLRDRLVQTMSKGMRQRLGIARMLLHDPKVLILDEPANGLDPRARIEMRELIEELRSLGKTILLSSHILTELSDMCTSVAILEKGRLLAGGSVDAIGRTLKPERAVKIRVLAPPADVEAILARGPEVLSVERDPDGAYKVQYRGSDETLADLVDHCVSQKLRLLRVEPDQNDLERIFLEVTKGELQ
ncbi:ABC transporter ATP-binding protein [Sandaracinus amylolyticus]|uniref:ABC transporter, ATP-binding protein n=1 Tax=Sandaracinus amylolyticus TaxID=927083 RepID=A0A0F6W547_9BACT|nr:ABC transporter ATP-binding protein [Sandaracinus amylolyticus]AKF07667.1 ABC transporter, ATP-binding protein [Sandaracinus amylolyticus]UJR79737.1 Daunorubicin/doxorubicin resistance ATP-binding protein DrrA [Sandaracinus amylolyticus]